MWYSFFIKPKNIMYGCDKRSAEFLWHMILFACCFSHLWAVKGFSQRTGFLSQKVYFDPTYSLSTAVPLLNNLPLYVSSWLQLPPFHEGNIRHLTICFPYYIVQYQEFSAMGISGVVYVFPILPLNCLLLTEKKKKT